MFIYYLVSVIGPTSALPIPLNFVTNSLRYSLKSRWR